MKEKGNFMIKKVLIILLLLTCGLLNASGTEAGASINAKAIDLAVFYYNEAADVISKSAVEFSIPDDTQTVLEINGIVQEGFVTASIASFYDNGTYRGIKGGEAGTVRQYPIGLNYRNRGNTAEDVMVTSSLSISNSRWQKEDQGILNLAEDQVRTFIVTLNVQNPINLEDITMLTMAKLVTATNVVSYNSFIGAVGYYEGGEALNVGYGGTNNIQNTFYFEAEGATLEFISKTYSVLAPSGYAGAGNTTLVPGAKIQYVTTVKNTSTAVATNVRLRDKIPNNCHYYPGEAPELLNEANDGDASWIGGSTNTQGAGAVIGWDDVSISPNETITIKYSVTVD